MKILIILLILTQGVYAKFAFAPGLILSQSKAYPEDQPILDKSLGFGFNLDSELQLPLSFSAVLSLQYYSLATTVAYDYQNPNDPSDNAKVDSLTSSILNVAALPGLRLHILNLKKFKLFIGAGKTFGYSNLTHNQDDFEERTGSSSGFLTNSSSSTQGSYSEVGLRYFIKRKGAIQLNYKKMKYSSNEALETIGNKKISLSEQQLNFLYVHIVDWSFFWR